MAFKFNEYHLGGTGLDAVLESLKVTENGTYTPAEGVDGFDEVVVAVAGGGSGDIVDVTELPTENIDENAVYRVTTDFAPSIYLVMPSMGVTNFVEYYAGMGMTLLVNLVDELPETLTPPDMSTMTMSLYVIRQTGIVYMSQDGQTAVTLGDSIGVPNKGWVTNIDELDATNPEHTGFCCIRGSTSISLYTRSNGEWVGYIDDEIQERYDNLVTESEQEISELTNLANGLERMFEYNHNTSTLTLPNVVKLRNHAFSSTDVAFSIFDTPKLTAIGAYAFQNCSHIEFTSLPDGVTSIGDGAFQNCGDIALTQLPDGLTVLFPWCFANCPKLAITSIPKSVTTIYGNVFRGCTGLTSITFEGTPESIGENVFYGCTNLTDIYVPWAEGAVSGAPWGAPSTCIIHYNHTN